MTMTSQSPKEYYYTYYSYEEWGRGYIGSRGCKCLPEEDINYLGSYSDKTFNPTQKIILGIYETREEAVECEIILQKYYKVVENPHFANKSYQTSSKFWYKPSKEECERNNKKRKELGVGIYGLTEQQIKDRGIKSSETRKKLGLGIFGFTPNQRHENAKNAAKYGGKKAKELGVGIHAFTTEQRSELGKSVCSQKWECLETGFITNPGNLTKYQKARGIDTSKRKRLS